MRFTFERENMRPISLEDFTRKNTLHGHYTKNITLGDGCHTKEAFSPKNHCFLLFFFFEG